LAKTQTPLQILALSQEPTHFDVFASTQRTIPANHLCSTTTLS